MNPTREQMRAEAERRAQALTRSRELSLALAHDSFGPQQAFVNDDSRYITNDSGRRAGKTGGICRKLARKALADPRSEVLYAAISKPHAIKLLWADLRLYCDVAKLGVIFNEQKHTATFPNQSVVYFGGVSDKEEREKQRGGKWRLVVLDETGSMGPYLNYFIEDVLTPTLLDYNGQLVLAGTPSPQAAGKYYDACHDTTGEWSHHHWTVLDNPRIPQWANNPQWQDIAKAFVAALKVKTPDAKFRREYMGEWVRDIDALLYGLSPESNIYTDVPHDTYDYVIGADTGYNDASATVVIAASHTTSRAYVVDEWEKSGVLIDALAAQIKTLLVRYPQAQVVIDPANKQLVESMRILYNLPLQLADKAGKAAHIDVLNSGLHAGQLLFPKGSATFDQMSSLEWNDQHTREREGYPADLGDACLYAYTHAHQQNFFRQKDAPHKMTDHERMLAEERRLIEAVMEKLKPERDVLDYDESVFGDGGEI